MTPECSRSSPRTASSSSIRAEATRLAACVVALGVSCCVVARSAEPADAAPFDIEINGERHGVHLVERDSTGQWCIGARPLAEWRVAIEPDARSCVVLAHLPGAKLRVDARAGRLVLELPPSAFVARSVDLDRRPSSPPQAGVGGFLAYDITALKARASGTDYRDLAGTFSANAFAGEWSALHDMAARDASGERRAIRLNTSVRREDPNRMATLVLGDAIGAAGVLAPPVRFGGISYGTNFALRPDFIPFPLPTLRGHAALPSAADLLVNGERRAAFPLQPGPFEVQGLPFVTGSGEAQLTTRDVLGRQQVLTVPFYVAPSLLRAGLDEYRIDAGLLREGFAERSNGYTDAFAAAQWRRGITGTWTAEARGEAMRDRASAALGSQWIMGGFGLATVGAGVSAAREGGGHGWVAGFERQGGALSFGVRGQWASRHFAALGSDNADRPRARLLSANAGWSFGRWGSLGLAAVHEKRRDGERLETGTGSYSMALGRDTTFVLSAGRLRFDGRTEPFAGASLLMSFGDGRTGGTSASRNGGATSYSLQAQSAMPPGEGWAWRVLATDYLGRRLDGGLSWQGARSTVGLEASTGRDAASVRANVSGTVLMLDRKIFLARKLGESFAVAEVPGVEGVRIYLDNQEVARTDERGFAVVPRLNPYLRQTLRLDTSDIPLDADLRSPTLEVVPFGRNGMHARFPLRKQHSILLRLVQEDGSEVPAGASAEVAGAMIPVGRDGVTFIADPPARGKVNVQWGSQRCVATLPEDRPRLDLPEFDAVVCVRELRS